MWRWTISLGGTGLKRVPPSNCPKLQPHLRPHPGPQRPLLWVIAQSHCVAAAWLHHESQLLLVAHLALADLWASYGRVECLSPNFSTCILPRPGPAVTHTPSSSAWHVASLLSTLLRSNWADQPQPRRWGSLDQIKRKRDLSFPFLPLLKPSLHLRGKKTSENTYFWIFSADSQSTCKIKGMVMSNIYLKGQRKLEADPTTYHFSQCPKSQCILRQ